MQSIFKSTIIITLLLLLICCSRDFLNEKFYQDSLQVGTSNIYISPDWQSANYIFKLPSIKDVDYEIVSKPSWLNIGLVKGHMSDSIAIVQFSATRNSDFNNVGVYLDFMTIKAGGENYKVPVTYITEGDPIVQVKNTLDIPYDMYGYPNLPIQNNGFGILAWKIISMPDWIVIDTALLESKDINISPHTLINLPLRFKLDKISTGSLEGMIVLSTNDKRHPKVTINVTTYLGNPKLSISTNQINFSYTKSSENFVFSNYGNGRLIWEFKDLPAWLTITPSKGIYNGMPTYDDIIFNCDRTKLSTGQNTAILNLKTNDSSSPSTSITVRAIAPGITDNMRTIDGNIIDVVFNKNTNILYYITSVPNKFITYDVSNRIVMNEISLSKTPTSLAISDDWTKATIGHNGFLSAVNLSNNTLTAIYTLDYSVNSIAWAENDWFCYTQNGGSYSCLHWINTANGNLYDDNYNNNLDGRSIVKKVPNQAYIIASRNSTSPNGIFAYDIATKSKKSYSSLSLNNFWFSDNGDYIFDGNLNVYRTANFTESTNIFDAPIIAIDKINIKSDYNYGLRYIYHTNNYLWILKKDSYSEDELTSFYQVEDNGYTTVKKIVYDVFWQPDAQTDSFKLSANYVFVNNKETEIVILCKGVDNNSWVVQFIVVK